MDIKSIRENTPGLQNVVHFNNAGAALVSRQVLETQLAYLKEEAAYGGYETAAAYHKKLEAFYQEAANLINASPEEIAFTESATVAWQRAFFSIPFKEGDVVLTSKTEYASNFISYLHLKKQKGIVIKVIPSNEVGEIDITQLEQNIGPRTKLIAITHIPTNGGVVNPAEEVGAIARKHNILFLLDACQSVGHYPVDVEKTGCHFLSATGRKYLRGPRGTGFLYVNKKVLDMLEPDSLDLHSAEWISNSEFTVRQDARKFETWESNLGAKLGITQAIREINHLGIHAIWNRIVALADDLRTKLKQISEVEVKDLGKQKCGIVTFSVPISAGEMKNALSAAGINTTVAIKSGTLLDMNDRNIEEMVRASVHYYNTTEEIDHLIKAINKTLRD